jgi:hypothetical protein
LMYLMGFMTHFNYILAVNITTRLQGFIEFSPMRPLSYLSEFANNHCECHAAY